MILGDREVFELTDLTGWRFVNHQARKRLLVDLARRHFPAGARIADLGCGPGDLALELQALGFAVVGVDFEPRRIERARALAEKYRLGTRFLVGDLALAAERAAFDGLVLGEVLEHFTEPREVLQRHLELLKPGGIALVTVPNVASLRARLKLLAFGEFADHNPEHRFYFTRRRMLEHFRGLPIEYVALFSWLVEATLPASAGWARLERRALEPLRRIAPWCGAHLVAVLRKTSGPPS